MRQLGAVLVTSALLAASGWGHAYGQPGPDRTPITSDNAAALETLASLDSELEGVQDIAFSPDGSLLAAGGYTACDPEAERYTCPGAVVVWDVASGEALNTLEAHAGPVTSVAFSPDGRLLAALGADAQIRVWNMPEGDIALRLNNEQGVGDVTFNFETTVLASTGTGGAVRIWSVEDGAEHDPVQAGYSTKTSLAFSPVEPVLAMGSYRSIGVWRVLAPSDNGGVVNVPSANLRSGPSTEYRVLGVAYAGDVLTITGTSETGEWYSIETADGLEAWIAGYLVDTGFEASRAPTEIMTITLPFEGQVMVTDLVFSGDGSLLASANTTLDDRTGSVAVWRLVAPATPEGEATPTPTPTPAPDTAPAPGPELIGSLTTPDQILEVAFNPGADLIAFASQPPDGDGSGGSLHVWGVANQDEVAAFEAPVSALAFSPDGTWLAGGRSDGGVELWGVAEE